MSAHEDLVCELCTWDLAMLAGYADDIGNEIERSTPGPHTG